MEILFKTIHGSRLYGLASSSSDEDYYTIIANQPRRRSKFAKQTIIGNEDSLLIDLSTFMMQCNMGVPQALEAMFSPCSETSKIDDLRQSYMIDTGATVARYRRTIKSFSLGDSFKKRRHALRLALNLTEALEHGRFNPRLSAEDAEFITEGAGSDSYFDLLQSLTGLE